ncbi:MAG TPA: hypothetical protein PLZ86_00265 [bacterium]|nr:hypothetical protein [bacterium]
MSLLDKFVEAFSAKELRPRVMGVIAFGLVVAAATAAAGLYFMKWKYTISVEGTAVWDNKDPEIIEATISEEDLGRIQPDRPLTIEIVHPDGSLERYFAVIVEIDPASGKIRLDAKDLPSAEHIPGRFSVRLILVEEPYWKLLWGPEPAVKTSSVQ